MAWWQFINSLHLFSGFVAGVGTDDLGRTYNVWFQRTISSWAERTHQMQVVSICNRRAVVNPIALAALISAYGNHAAARNLVDNCRHSRRVIRRRENQFLILIEKPVENGSRH